MTPEAGTLIGGKYRLDRPLAAGGMGAVWVAHHVGLDVAVAVKRMSPLLAANPVARARFEREAKAAARLQSPHVVHVHDFGVEDGAPYIAMELLLGEDLGALLERQRRLSLPRASAIFAQACKGVKAAHDAGIVHRDIKPSNLFLARMGDDEVVKVLDFGIAHPSELAQGADRTASGAVVGTPHFMSPEQARGAETGPATDLWSLAVVLFVMLTGEQPFPGNTVGEILASVLRDEPPLVARIAPGLPPSLDRFFAQALARDPNKRFASATAMAEAFAAVVGSISREDATLEASSGSGAVPRSEQDTLGPTLEASPGSDRSAAPGAPRADPAPPRRGTGGTTGQPPSPPRALPLQLAIGVAAAALVLVAVLVWRSPQGGGPEPLPTSSAVPPPRPTAITDLPPPVSTSPAALAAYAGALQAMRDANWDRAETRLREAVSADPTFAMAHLRLAMTLGSHPVEARASHARALEGRKDMNDRDRRLLAALEPQLRDPQDTRAANEAYCKASEAYPLDAELVVLCAFSGSDLERSIALYRRAVELDPAYADAWQGMATALDRARRFEEALLPLDQCLTLSPTSVDCLGQRATDYQRLGRCAEMDSDVRRAISLQPRSAALQWVRLQSLERQGQSPEALLEVLKQKWASVPEAQRRGEELFDRAELALYTGKFTEAESLARELQKLADAGSDRSLHRGAADVLESAALATGRDRDAAVAIDAYLKRRDGLPGSGQDASTIHMLRVVLHGGLLSRAAFEARRRAWIAQQSEAFREQGPWSAWLATNAGAEEPDEVAEALAAVPQGVPDPTGEEAREMGRLLLLAGKPREALGWLQRTQKWCDAAATGPSTMWLLGQALDQTKDTEGACSAYAAVLSRWGAAVPRAVIAEKARARSAALRCKPVEK